MKAGSELLKRQQTPIHFRNKDMDFMLNWSLGISQLIGMSPGEILLIAQKIRNGQPQDWESGFKQHAHYLAEQARRSLEKGTAARLPSNISELVML